MDRKRIPVMVRQGAGFVILAALLLTGLLSGWLLFRQYDDLSRQLEDAAWWAMSGNWEQARDTAVAVRTQWRKHWNIQAAFTDHTPMEEIDSLFAQLAICAASGDREQFAAVCVDLAQHIRAVGDAHRLTWWNLL